MAKVDDYINNNERENNEKKIEPIYDKFEPFQSLETISFVFLSTRYEKWIGGNMVASGESNTYFQSRNIVVDGEKKIELFHDDLKLNNELANNNVFDKIVTAHDRIQLITIPNETNSENIGITMLKMIIGSTRNSKSFNYNEPYCCNLFLHEGKLSKVTFSYSNPEKLLEFYSDSVEESFDIGKLDFIFYSSDHIRYQNGIHISGPHGGAYREIHVKSDINCKEGFGYIVTILNPAGVNMLPKPMMLEVINPGKIMFRGYGYDQMGNPFADYGLTVFTDGEIIEKCILHMYDRGVDIEYLT